jgi:general secretion pathway protein J
MKRARGFTLIELLVAMAILAIVGIMALGGLNQVIKQRGIARERTERWDKIQLAMRLITKDLSQIQPRPTRDATGSDFQPAVLAGPDAEYALELSRGGWSNPAGFARGTVLRVAYQWQDDKLLRIYWPVMDRTLSTPPIRQELLDGVEKVEVRFLGDSGQWQMDWPPLGVNGPASDVLRPRAIEFSIELKDFGRITRLVETGG